MSFAGTGMFFRYEAYLVGLGIVVVLLEISDLVTKRKLIVRIRRELICRNAAAILLAIVFLSPLFYRAAAAFSHTPKASTNVFQQQYQMGLFLRRYYQGSTVAVNDLGAVNFLADLHCLDLCGLASMEVAELIRQGRYQTEYMRQITKQENVKIAMVYDTWFSGGRYCKLPAEWTRVGQWTIPNNIIAGSETVSIYAIDAAERGPPRRPPSGFLLPVAARGRAGRFIHRAQLTALGPISGVTRTSLGGWGSAHALR